MRFARRILTVLACALPLAPSLAEAQELAPPPPLDPSNPYAGPTAPRTATEERLERAEREDSGRGLEFFYANAGAAFSAVGLTTLNDSDLAVAGTSAVGGAFDAGLGLRLLILSFGPRLRYHKLTEFDLWQINGEVNLHIPISRLDLNFGVHGGYSFIGSFAAGALGAGADPDAVRVRGFDVGLQLGLDYYLTPHFSLGGDVSAEVLAMSRPALARSTDPAFGTSGGAVGLGGLVGVRAGLHF